MDSGQTFSNHARLVPLYHFVTLGLCAVTVIASLVNLVLVAQGGDRVFQAVLIVALAVAILLAAIFARTFALRVQDRVIRLEENFRHHNRKGQGLDSRLTMRQIIALRFASDDEFDELAARAITDGLSEKEIKQAIRNWRADYVRA